MAKGNVVAVFLVGVVLFLVFTGNFATALFLGFFALLGHTAATVIERLLAARAAAAPEPRDREPTA